MESSLICSCCNSPMKSATLTLLHNIIKLLLSLSLFWFKETLGRNYTLCVLLTSRSVPNILAMRSSPVEASRESFICLILIYPSKQAISATFWCTIGWWAAGRNEPKNTLCVYRWNITGQRDADIVLIDRAENVQTSIKHEIRGLIRM